MNLHPVVEGLLAGLAQGGGKSVEEEEVTRGGVGGLARIYEVARNALEYRAEHLARRAAIERILRRENVFGGEAHELSEVLGQELVWARYLSENSWRRVRGQLKAVLEKYLILMKQTQAPTDFVFAVMSAELEEKINPNRDYQQFTTFAFHAIKGRVRIEDKEDEDLLLLAAVDTVYSQVDDAGLGYHLFKLLGSQGGEEVTGLPDGGLGLTYGYFCRVRKDPLWNSVTAAVRKQCGPLNLIRDMYFAKPEEFLAAVVDQEKFALLSRQVLWEQLGLMGERMARATGRSVGYIFLTKMILGVGLELPLEKAFSGQVSWVALGVNLSVPVVLMWVLAAGIKLPGESQQKRLLARAWEVMADFGAKPSEDEVYWVRRDGSRRWLAVFYVLYALLFILIFTVVFVVLSSVGFSVVSIGIFMFFVSVVAFFAFRIRQTSMVYTWQARGEQGASLVETAMLPLVIVGGALSREVARLNFLVLIFDFLLEAPFKTILRFFDRWTHFLSAKRDEMVG